MRFRTTSQAPGLAVPNMTDVSRTLPETSAKVDLPSSRSAGSQSALAPCRENSGEADRKNHPEVAESETDECRESKSGRQSVPGTRVRMVVMQISLVEEG